MCTRGLKKIYKCNDGEKRKGVTTTNLLTICLIEVDFKFNNNILARDLMKCAQRIGTSPREKYSRRNEEKIIMYAVNKQLLYDTIQLQQKPAILCSNDTKYCYNRIVHSVEIIKIQWLGMPAHTMK